MENMGGNLDIPLEHVTGAPVVLAQRLLFCRFEGERRYEHGGLRKHDRFSKQTKSAGKPVRVRHSLYTEPCGDIL